MFAETRTPMQCPHCGVDVLHITIDEGFYRAEEGVVDPEPIESSNAGLVYQLHECNKEGETQ